MDSHEYLRFQKHMSLRFSFLYIKHTRIGYSSRFLSIRFEASLGRHMS